MLSPARRYLGIVASTLGILQGLSWAGMSLAAIIIYNSAPGVNSDESTNYGKLLNELLYNRFLSDTNSSQEIRFIIRPFDFTIFMWIYFLFSIGWVAVSVDQLAAIYYNRRRQTVIMVLWGIVTLILSLIDLIFVCLLARDYAACNEVGDYKCFLPVGIVMSIAARGYALWVINLVFSVLVIYMSVKVKNDKFGLLNSDHRIPRAQIPKRSPTNSLFDDEKIPPYLQDSETSTLPSFLSRGDKFTY